MEKPSVGRSIGSGLQPKACWGFFLWRLRIKLLTPTSLRNTHQLTLHLKHRSFLPLTTLSSLPISHIGAGVADGGLANRSGRPGSVPSMRGSQGKMHRYTLKEIRCIFFIFLLAHSWDFSVSTHTWTTSKKPQEKSNKLIYVCRYFKDKERMQRDRHVKINQALIFKRQWKKIRNDLRPVFYF